MRRVVEESLDPLVGDEGAAILPLEVADDALEDGGDDQRDRGPHHRPAPVAERVAGGSDHHDRDGEREDGQRTRDPQLVLGPGDREPEDGQQEENRHARRRTSGAGTRRVVEQGGVGKQEIGSQRIQPRGLRSTLAREEDDHDRDEAQDRKAGDPPRTLVGRQEHGQQADCGHHREREGECGRAPPQIGG